MTRPAPFIAGIVAALLLLLGAYMGSYYAMLERTMMVSTNAGQGPGLPLMGEPMVVPVYRNTSTAVPVFYWPAHQIDRLIRPSYWQFPRGLN